MLICVDDNRNTKLLQMEVSPELLLQHLKKDSGVPADEDKDGVRAIRLTEAEQRAALDYFKDKAP